MAENKKQGQGAALVAGAGGLGIGWMLGNKSSASGGGSVDLTALLNAIDSLNQTIALLQQTIANWNPSVMGYPANLDTIFVTRINCPVANTPYQGPDVAIVDGFSLFVKADPINPVGSLIYVGPSPADAINPQSSEPLMPSETYTPTIKNAKELYVSANVGGCSVYFSVEKRR